MVEGMRLTHESGALLVATSLSIRNIYAGYQEGGPDARRLLEQMRGGFRDRPMTTCARWDPLIDPRMPSTEIMMRVPRWLHTAHIAYAVNEEPREGVVTWLADAPGDASLEEMLLGGVGDAKLDQAISPVTLAGPSRADQTDPVTADGVRVSTGAWTLVFGPRVFAIGDDERVFRGAEPVGERFVEAGSVMASTRLSGPPPTPHGVDRWRWHGRLLWHSLLTPAGASFGSVVAAAIGRLSWQAYANEWFDDSDDY